jgi:hypothetical protein
MIHWMAYPRFSSPTTLMRSIVQVFEASADDIGSGLHRKESNAVLAVLEPGLTDLGFTVESGKRSDQKISVPVLFGMNGRVEKGFEADASHAAETFIVEVEAVLHQQPVPEASASGLHEA